MVAWNPRAYKIFVAVLDIAQPERRKAQIDAACGDDVELRRQVEALLKVHAQAEHSLEITASPEFTGAYAPQPGVSALPTMATEQAGKLIGPYKLLQKLGEGGMGTVWVAEQSAPVKRRVALKLIKAGMDSTQVLHRFEAERQALALMDHQYIAKVLDAGTTPEGRPYFAMELIKGIPITKYCDQEHLNPRERLELFIPVCQAVQHAHQKGVIHRDLKPSNVLIALYDGKPVPKVIDFGVAKATSQKLTERTMFTEVGQIVGTLEYMAPEQAELNNLDIDTRADIYSLGVILYELLAGSPPFTARQLKGAAFTEMLRMIREVEPQKPSTRISSSNELPSIAANRKQEPKRLTRLVHGDLDWIVMKALEKERSRRYETANGFALDIQRYLADEPVLAGPPRAGYRLRKLIRRNKGVVLAAAAVATALVLGTVVSTWQAVAATRARADLADKNVELAAANERERERFNLAMEAIKTFHTGVSEDLLLKQKEFGTLRGKLLRGAQEFYQKLEHQVGKQTDLNSRLSLGRAYFDVGELTNQLGSKQESLAIHRRTLALFEELQKDHPGEPAVALEVARNNAALAIAFSSAGQKAEALAAGSRAHAILETLAEADPYNVMLRGELARAVHYGGEFLFLNSRVVEGMKAFERARASQEDLVRGNPSGQQYRLELAETCDSLGVRLDEAGRQGEARASYDRAIELEEGLFRENPTDANIAHELVRTLGNRAILLAGVGRRPEAIAGYRRAQDVLDATAKTSPTLLAVTRDRAWIDASIAAAYIQDAQYAEALIALERARKSRQILIEADKSVVRDQAQLAYVWQQIGEIHNKTGRTTEALAAFREAAAVGSRLAADHPDDLEIQSQLAQCYLNIADGECAKDNAPEALVWSDKAVAIQRKLAEGEGTKPEARLPLGDGLRRHGIVLQNCGRPAAAVSAFREAITILEGLPSPDKINLYDLACCQSLLFGIAAVKDSGLTPPDGQAQADKAFVNLRRAIAIGWNDAAHTRDDTDLKAVSGQGEFAKVLAEMELKAKAEKK